MEDSYFEEELIKREKIEIIENLRNYVVNFRLGDIISETTKSIYQKFDDIIYIYYEKKFGNSKNYNEIDEMIENFKNQLTDNKLIEAYNTYEFSSEEIEYIKLVEISSTWKGKHSFDVTAKYAIIEILLKAKIIEEFGAEAIQTFIDIMQNELSQSPKYAGTIKQYMQLFSDNPYGDNIHNKLEHNIDEKAKQRFNDKINCGGYALKIDQCIYPTNQNNFSKSISSILDRFPFVRLLGDKKLEDDEYLVIYRAPEGKNSGHHFIRVDDDAMVKEKDGNGQPRVFQNWGNLTNATEALFAVKKDHKMFGYNSREINYNYKKGLNFEESVAKAISEKNNSFSYHNHNFSLKKSKDDEIIIISDNGEIIAEVVADESECLVEVQEDKKKYVENFSCDISPIICNGKLINFQDFKQNRLRTNELEGR